MFSPVTTGESFVSEKAFVPEPLGWRRWAGRLADLLYPPLCACCGETASSGRALCGGCHGRLPRLASPFCRICGEARDGRIEGAFSCPNCRGLSFAFDFVRPALVWSEPARDLIHRLKYGREIHLARELGGLAAEAFEDPRLASPLAGRWPLVPVPLHRSRFQHRHFNQAEEIARGLAQATGLPVVRALRRVRRTDSQTRLSRARRLENLRGAFVPTSAGRSLAGSGAGGVVLVDDVFTTGATVHECARVLKRAGVQNVIVVTLMRG